MNNSILENNSLENFSIFIFNSLVSEKILYLLSLIAEKSELKQTKIIIYINLLDLSPVYNVKLRLFVLGDLYNFCLDTYKRCIKRRTLIETAKIKENSLLCHMILARHKIRSLYFSSKSNIIKNVVLLFDMNFPILKDKHFLIYFKKFFRRTDIQNYFYLSFFDEYLFLFKNFRQYELEKAKMNESIDLHVKESKMENKNHYQNINSIADHDKNYDYLVNNFTRKAKGNLNENDENKNKSYFEDENKMEKEEKGVDFDKDNIRIQNNINQKVNVNDNDSLNSIKSNECN